MTRRFPNFHPAPLPTLVMILLAVLCCGLGIWQLDRAGQKRAQALLISERATLPPLILGEEPVSAEETAHRRIIAQGEFADNGQIYIENRRHLGRVGYHVITPLLLTAGQGYLLVNRGWIAAERSGEVPDISTPQGPVEISGEAVIPSPPALELGGGAMIPPRQQRWPYLTLESYAAWSGLKLQPFLLLQTGGAGDGLVRAWPRTPPNDAMHIGYAVQWFAFALIALGIWLKLSLGGGHRQRRMAS
jgi:surfeit locus 1 family protein